MLNDTIASLDWISPHFKFATPRIIGFCVF
jgi:hypothetical protein